MRRCERKGGRPEKLAAVAVVDPQAAAFADRDDDVALLASRDVRVDPLDESRVGVERRPDQRLLMVDVHVPVVTGQVLVVPDELARAGTQRHRRVAVEVGRRRARNRRVVAAVTGRARVRHRIGHAPIQQIPGGVVRAGQAPGRGAALARGRPRPRLCSRLAFPGRRVKAPDLLAGERVVGRDVAVLAGRVARASRNDLAVDDDGSRGVRLGRDGRLPPHLAGRRVESDDGARLAARAGRGVVDHVRIDGERLDPRRRGAVHGDVLPEALAGRGVERPHGAAGVRAAGHGQIHHAAIDDRNDLDDAVGQRSGPGFAQPLHVRPVDLIERAEPLRVVRATVH